MPSLIGLLLKWPVIRQIRQRTDGTGLEASVAVEIETLGVGRFLDAGPRMI
jgi:hypothetical protein